MLVFWTIWFQNYTINCFSITFFGITKVANLNVIWMRANNSSHRQLTSCIIRCFDSRPGSEGEEPSLQCVITCYSIPRLFPPSPVALMHHMLFTVHSYIFLILLQLLVVVLNSLFLSVAKRRQVENCWEVATLSRK